MSVHGIHRSVPRAFSRHGGSAPVEPAHRLNESPTIGSNFGVLELYPCLLLGILQG